MINLTLKYIERNTPSWEDIREYTFGTISSCYAKVHAHLPIDMTPERTLEITMLALSALGTAISYKKKNNTAVAIFAGILVVQIALISTVFNYGKIKTRCEELEDEVKIKETLNLELAQCSQKMRELTDKLGPLEEKLSLIQETRQDVSTIVDMLIQSKAQNAKLQAEIEEKIALLEAQAGTIQQSAASLERSASKVEAAAEASEASVQTFQRTAKKLASLTSKLDQLLQTANRPV